MKLSKIQGKNSILIHSSAEKLWQVLEDGQTLPQYALMVESTDGQKETLNSVRTCQVNLQGRRGTVVEKCILFEPYQKIGWKLESDTLGFDKMLKDFMFFFEIEPQPNNTVRLTTYSCYEEKNLLAKIMMKLIMKKKFETVRKNSLEGLKKIVES